MTRRPVLRWPSLPFLLLLPFVLPLLPGAAAAAVGGPVLIGGDDADGEGAVDDCLGCGPNQKLPCTNTCFTRDCQDAARTVFAGGGDIGEDGGACRQFDGNQAQCEAAWHLADGDVPATCFFCQGTEGQCQSAGECRGCGPSNGRNGACTNTCLPCADATRTTLASPSNACRGFDGDQAACEQAWHLNDDGVPSSCFFCQGSEGNCSGAGQCRGCGRNNSRNGACMNTCVPCADAALTTFVPSGNACRRLRGDLAACSLAWHVDQNGLPASCFPVPGNRDGWRYIEEGFRALGPNVTNGKTVAVCLGCNEEPESAGSASGAFESAFDASGLPGMGWTRVRLSTREDIIAFFDGTGVTAIDDAGLIYMPSDDDNVDGGITGARCRGCGPRNELAGRCTNECGPALPATCLDAGRTIAAGGPRDNACKQFIDQATCEQAWHSNKGGVPTTCAWDLGEGECRGCSRGSDEVGCTNTCVARPTCADGTRTVDAGGPGGSACRQFLSQGSCEQAWHATQGNMAASCFWTGSDCQGCGPHRERDGACTNTCGPAPACADMARTTDAGGPGGNACRDLGDEAACDTAWHVTAGGKAASCFFDDQIGVVNANAQALADFVAAGGGLFTRTQEGIRGGYGWLETLVPGLVAEDDQGCQDEAVRLTPAGASALPGLANAGASGLVDSRSRFAGNLGGLAVVGASACTRPVFRCVDPTRTVQVEGGGAGDDGGSCRQFDGDPLACEAAWHPDDDGVPASCFVCQGTEGACDAAGECRGCGYRQNARDGACTNTCVGDELCASPARTNLVSQSNACPQFSGDAASCLAAWHFDNDGNPASCFVCEESGDRCNGPGDCRGCGERNLERGVCENDCDLFPRVCQDRKRKVQATGEEACRQFSSDPKQCGSAWHLDDDGVPATCFVCQGTEGNCGAAGECRGCGPTNRRAGACTDTCGAPLEGAVILGGPQVALGAPALDHFEGYKLKKAPKLAKSCHVLLDDTTSNGWDGPIEFTLAKVASLLAPADKVARPAPPTLFPPLPVSLDALRDPATHLVAYQMKRKKGETPKKHVVRTGVLVQNQFGTLRFDTKKEDRLLVPANKDLVGPPPLPDGGAIEVDHYKCYQIKLAKTAPGTQQSERGKFLASQALVVDQFENGAGHPDFGAGRLYDLKKPTRFCIPVVEDTGTDSSCPITASGPLKQPDVGLTCYQKKVASKGGASGREKIVPKQAKHVQRAVFVHSSIDEHAFSTNKEEELCVPSQKLEEGVPKL